jgi:hypothetical protein
MENTQQEYVPSYRQQHQRQLENCGMIHSSLDPTGHADATAALPRSDGIVDQQSECDEEEFTIVSMSPDEGNTFFPSRSSNAPVDLRYGNLVRPSRDSVLQKLCDALLRRSLTKVRVVRLERC